MEVLKTGDLVVIKHGALVRRYQSEEEHYSWRLQSGMVLMLNYAWIDLGSGAPELNYLVLFSHDMRMYYVARRNLLLPDQIGDALALPQRLKQLSG